MIFKIDGEFIMFLVCGYYELNEVKLKLYFGMEYVEMVILDEIVNFVDVNLGFFGFIFDKDIKIYVDNYL